MSKIDEFYLTDIKHSSDLVISSGDLEIQSGLKNIKNQLIRRLITIPGSIVHRPNYGVGISTYQNSVISLAKRQRLAALIKDQFESDERVDTVTGVSFDSDDSNPDIFKVSIGVNLIGFGESNISYESGQG